MIHFPPELLMKILREIDIDILLPLLKNDNVSDVFKECFEVVTNHKRKSLEFWPKSFKRSHLDTVQPVKGKRYLIEFETSKIDDWYDGIREVVLKKLLDLNGFVYLYSRRREGLDPVFDRSLDELLRSETLLVVGTDSLRDFSFHGKLNLDRLRYIPQSSLELMGVIPEGELNQNIRNLTITAPHDQKIFDFISPTVFKSLETFKLSSGRDGGEPERRSLHVTIKHIEFSRLKTCTLLHVSQVENLKFPKLHTLHITLRNNGDWLYLKDIEAPELRYFSITTNCDFEVKNVVTNDDLEKLTLKNTSRENVEIKGLEDWCVTTNTLRLVEMATALSSKSFIQRSQNVIIEPSQREVQFLNSLKEENPGIKQLAFMCKNIKCPVIRVPNLEGLKIDTCWNADIPLLSQSYTSITKLELVMRDKELPKQFYLLKTLQNLRSLKLNLLETSAEKLGLDSPAWDLPNLESFDLQFRSGWALFDHQTIAMSAPKLKSLSVKTQSITFLTLKNLPSLKELTAQGFRELKIDDNMGTTIESIESRSLTKLKAKGLSNIKHMPQGIRVLPYNLRKRRRT